MVAAPLVCFVKRVFEAMSPIQSQSSQQNLFALALVAALIYENLVLGKISVEAAMSVGDCASAVTFLDGGPSRQMKRDLPQGLVLIVSTMALKTPAARSSRPQSRRSLSLNRRLDYSASISCSRRTPQHQ